MSKRKSKSCKTQKTLIEAHELLTFFPFYCMIKILPPKGYQGGLIFDEMSIQPDLQFRKRNGNVELIGITECTPESVIFDQIKSNKKEKTLATPGKKYF
jgi:hypothetical protein